MAKVATRRSSLGTITYPMRIERVRPTFTRLASVAQLLDREKLARAAGLRIEIGYLSTGQCRQLVRATVRRGMVTGFDIEPRGRHGHGYNIGQCKTATTRRAPRRIVQLVRRAERAAIRRGGGRAPRPMPVNRFLAQAAQIVIETVTCFRICFLGWCIYCCTTRWDGLVCGSEVVVTDPIIIF